jgi:hypothetical protein
MLGVHEGDVNLGAVGKPGKNPKLCLHVVSAVTGRAVL